MMRAFPLLVRTPIGGTFRAVNSIDGGNLPENVFASLESLEELYAPSFFQNCIVWCWHESEQLVFDQRDRVLMATGLTSISEDAFAGLSILTTL